MRPRKLLPALLLAVTVLCLTVPTSAAVIERDWLAPGDGLLTFDDVNQREWLDLTETQLFNFPGPFPENKFQSFRVELLPDGEFEGFSVAGREDVTGLAQSAGIDTSTTHFETNLAAATNLIGLVGFTGNPPSHGAAQSHGALDERPGRDGRGRAVVFVNTDSSSGLSFGNGIGDIFGVWLYRPVPEPSSLALSAGAFSGLFFVLRMRRRVS